MNREHDTSRILPHEFNESEGRGFRGFLNINGRRGYFPECRFRMVSEFPTIRPECAGARTALLGRRAGGARGTELHPTPQIDFAFGVAA